MTRSGSHRFAEDQGSVVFWQKRDKTVLGVYFFRIAETVKMKWAQSWYLTTIRARRVQAN